MFLAFVFLFKEFHIYFAVVISGKLLNFSFIYILSLEGLHTFMNALIVLAFKNALYQTIIKA